MKEDISIFEKNIMVVQYSDRHDDDSNFASNHFENGINAAVEYFNKHNTNMTVRGKIRRRLNDLRVISKSAEKKENQEIMLSPL